MPHGHEIHDAVKRARNPQEALLIVADGLDQIMQRLEPLMQPQVFIPPNPWGDWDDGDREALRETLAADRAPLTVPDNRARIEGDDVVVPPVSPEREHDRELFAVNTRLSEYYGPSLSPEDFEEAYVKGGPRWLYYTNRDCVMQMPMELRRELVADVLLDSPSEAAEISADILKFDESMPEGAQLEAQRARLGKP